MRAAVVAVERAFALVHGESRVAARAGRDPAAAGAEQRRRVAAAVQVDQHLAAGVEVAVDREQRRRRNALRVGMRAQVDQVQASVAWRPPCDWAGRDVARARRGCARGFRATASPSRARPGCRDAAPGPARGRARSSGSRPAACTTRRAPRRHDQARGARAARTRPSACRSRPAPCPRAPRARPAGARCR